MSLHSFFTEDYFKNVRVLQQQMIKSFEPVVAQLNKTSAMWNQLSTDFNYQIVDIINSAIKAVDWSSISRIYENIRELAEVFNKYSLIMIKMEWPPPLDVPTATMKEIINKYETSKEEYSTELKEYIDTTITSIYSQAVLKEKLDTWAEKAWLKKRIHILEEVINAHIEERYILSIPVILPQIEGIVVDGFGHKGKLNGKVLGGYIKSLLDRGLSIDDCIDNFVFSVILASFEFGQPLNSSLSRHAILHGADTCYASPQNSLKAIILFDYLQDAFVYASIDGSKVYHAIDCYILNNSRKARQIFRNTSVFDKLSKSPCKKCLK